VLAEGPSVPGGTQSTSAGIRQSQETAGTPLLGAAGYPNRDRTDATDFAGQSDPGRVRKDWPSWVGPKPQA